jgi:hypothetical protein
VFLFLQRLRADDGASAASILPQPSQRESRKNQTRTIPTCLAAACIRFSECSTSSLDVTGFSIACSLTVTLTQLNRHIGKKHHHHGTKHAVYMIHTMITPSLHLKPIAVLQHGVVQYFCMVLQHVPANSERRERTGCCRLTFEHILSGKPCHLGRRLKLSSRTAHRDQVILCLEDARSNI